MISRESVLRLAVWTIMVSGALASATFGEGQTVPAVDRGRMMYMAHCAGCHGVDGGGNGMGATGLTPPPTNFKDPVVMNGLTNNAMEQAILVGKANTAMQGYGTILDSTDVASVVLYIRTFAQTP